MNRWLLLPDGRSPEWATTDAIVEVWHWSVVSGQWLVEEKLATGMRKRRNLWLFLISLACVLLMQVQAIAKQHVNAEVGIKQVGNLEGIEKNVESESDKKGQLKPFDEFVKDAEKLEGLFTIYRQEKKNKIYLEIKPEQLQKNYLGVITLSTGIGEAGILKGMPIGEILFQFRRLQDKVEVVVPNINFRGSEDDRVQQTISRSFSDSVLYSLKIESIHPERQTLLIDLGSLLLGQRDLGNLSSVVKEVLGSSYSIDKNRSYFSEAKAFPLNVEIESVYGFKSGSGADIPSLPDSRAFSLSVHYSLSELPVNNGYRPRVADERVGYFVTAYKDLGNDNLKDPFVRYINRWHLEKQDPSAPLSPPKQPIVFWIENTVPSEYREAIARGVLMWNRAFTKAGFSNAIAVRQMPDDAEWNPEDVRYNTIRWSASFDPLFFGLGPSRVNPLTGEILDADILIDANIVRILKNEYRSFVGGSSGEYGPRTEEFNPCSTSLQQLYLPEVALPETQTIEKPLNSTLSQLMGGQDLCLGLEFNRQFAVGAIAMSLLHDVGPDSEEMEEYVQQYLSFLVAHEVGHTLGLRHNFRGSTMLKPEELNDRSITRTRGMVASVMDYLAVNLAPPGVEQGDYFPVMVGPYDEWAIEYGYKPNSPMRESQELQQIAQRAAEPELSYATDEDRFASLDPAANAFDLSSDMLRFSIWQLENAQAMWSRLAESFPRMGESYSEIREMFDEVLLYYFKNARNATLYVGGQSFHRIYPGDGNGRLPFEVIPVQKQREALNAIAEYVFASDAFQFSPQLLNQLAPSRWWHWGTVPALFRLDYPIGDRLFFVQRAVLRSLLAAPRLSRMRDLELKAAPEEVLMLPELFDTLQASIWTEVIQKDPENISSIRRSLQREYVDLLSAMVLRKSRVPEDARTLAWYHLGQLRGDIDKTLRKRGRRFDTYSKAHLAKTRDRIDKTLSAPLQSN